MSNSFRQYTHDAHAKEVADGLHDAECEWSAQKNYYLCNYSNRRRIKAGKTELPYLIINYSTCSGCYKDAYHDSDGFACDNCSASWPSDAGDHDVADHFTDDYGDLSRCKNHQRRGCWHCEHATPNGGQG